MVNLDDDKDLKDNKNNADGNDDDIVGDDLVEGGEETPEDLDSWELEEDME